MPWPTSQWPRAQLQAPLAARVAEHAAPLFTAPESFGETFAVLVVQHGAVVYERYADGVDARSTLPSWSMAKSITHALAGLLVADGSLELDAPAGAPEWDAGDPRSAITVRQLLAMRSGLAFTEDYVDRGVSDVMEMLWGSGRDDVAAFAAAKPLVHAPGAHFSYASGTTNILARVLGERVGGGEAGMRAFMRARLFAPIGITSAVPKFDAVGTFKGSSFCFCTTEDFARFGLLYLRDGVWAGSRILPSGWADEARTFTWREPGQALGHYGMHWWINDDGASFYASGYEGQRIVVDPVRDVVAVRLGKSSDERARAMHLHLMDVVGQLPAV